MAPAEKTARPFAVLFAPLREPNFRRLIISLSSCNFAANLAAPFFTGAAPAARRLQQASADRQVVSTALVRSNVTQGGAPANR